MRFVNKKNKKSSKTPKTHKYYYTKASIIRSVVISLACVVLFFAFFFCFMIYGGNDRSSLVFYKAVSSEEKTVLSSIDGIAADGKGRVYLFYSKTFEINAYSESGEFMESYQIPCNDSEEYGEYDGGIACIDGKMYAFNDVGSVFVFENGKGESSFAKKQNEDKFNQINELYLKGKDKAVTEDGKAFVNNYFFVSDGEGKIIINKFFEGFFFSPVSMVFAIIMTVLTYLSVKRYNKKVRNQKVKTIFKKSVIIE